MRLIKGLLKFSLESSRYLRPISVLRLIAAGRLTGSQPIKLVTNKLVPSECFFRPKTSDRWTAQEILVDEEYSSAVVGLPEDATVVDIGANIGLASRYFATHLPKSRVYAVEAMPETYEITRRNLSINGLADRCRVVNAAAWNDNTSIRLQIPKEGAYSRVSATEGETGVEVRAATIESLLDEFGIEKADLIKIDIEGAEVQAFATGANWLPRVNRIAIEFHGDSREKSNFDILMDKHGFTITRHSDHTIVAVRRLLKPKNPLE